ncbi:hypothetical protein R3P38DRAFT_3362839 [Favolaschia claudopus]|uniref:Zn(2)-C6 fungal-type domain-containing protein n=1 Tax=Favolaschia claudopus TaxID=2862362 RepID=A0AAW0AJQ8_9AGAR
MGRSFRFIMEPPQYHEMHGKRLRLITSCDQCRVKKKKCFQPSPKTNSKCEACTAAKIRCRFRDRKRYFAERRRGLPGSSAASDVSSPLRSSDAAVSQEAPSLPTAFPPTYSSYITRYYGCFVNPSHDLDAYKPVQSLTGPSPAHTLDINPCGWHFPDWASANMEHSQVDTSYERFY